LFRFRQTGPYQGRLGFAYQLSAWPLGVAMANTAEMVIVLRPSATHYRCPASSDAVRLLPRDSIVWSVVRGLAAALTALCAVPAPGGDLPADLAAAVSAYDQATVRGDIPALDRLVADDYVLVNSDASVENKRQYLADFNLPGFKIDPYVREQPMEKVWGDAAVVGGVVHLSWTQDGKHQARVLRLVYVWARRDGKWQMTYTQVTRVAAS
jgi:ketosteroid isomerase-like protein